MSATFWTERDPKYGLIHLAAPIDAASRPDPLIVYLHGILGSCEGTWKAMPELVLSTAKVDLDVLNFAYPAGLAGGDVEKAARDLREVLRARFASHRHVVFVTHSTGGLVVKAMMRAERAAMTAALAKNPSEYRSLDFEVLRARRIVNLDVPHDGASLSHSVLLLAYLGLIGPISFALGLIPFVPLGYNRIPRQLLFRNRWARGLERDYVEFMKELDELALPRPTSLEVLAATDTTIARYGEITAEKHGGAETKIRADCETLVMRGTHVTMKPAERTELICSVVGGRLRRWVADAAFVLTELTNARVFDFKASVGLDRLAAPTSTAAEADGRYSQGAACQRLERLIAAASESPRCIVLTGDAGVGKSVAVRVLVRTLCLRYLGAEDPFRRLPLLMPLQRVKLRADQVRRFRDGASTGDAWRVLAEDWCEFIDKFEEEESARRHGPAAGSTPVFDAEWVERRLDRPAVLILDAVDEFLSKNGEIENAHFSAMLRDLEKVHAANGRLTLVLGVRDTWPGATAFTRDPGLVVRIRRLTRAEAEDLFPAVREVLAKVPPEMLDLMLTPLILFQIEREAAAGRLAAERLETRSAIFEAALRAIVRKNELNLRVIDGQEVGEDACLDALMVVAWRYLIGSHGEMAHADILRSAQATDAEWRGRAPEAAASGRAPWRGIALVARDEDLRCLLRQTVFFPTGPDTYRVLHREWEEALAARHLAACIRHRATDDLGEGASTNNMLRMAGEQLADLSVDASLVKTFLDRASETGLGYIAGNFSAVLANSAIPLEAGAIRMLLERNREILGASRYVLIATLGYRALRRREAVLVDQVVPAFATLVAEAHAGGELRAVGSLAWCCLRRLAPERPMPPWPEPGADGEDDKERALRLVFTPDSTGAIRPVDRSIQSAFVRIQHNMAADPDRPISLVHYLYVLCLAARCHGQIKEVEDVLPELLAPGGRYERSVEAYRLPELTRLLAICRREFGRRADGS